MRLCLLALLSLTFIVVVKAQSGSGGGSGGGGGNCRCPNCSEGCCKGSCSGGGGSGGGPSTAAASAQTQAGTTAGQQATTAGSTGKKKGGGGKCFSGDDTVVTNLGTLKMSELVGKEDIKVLTRNSQTEQFEMSPVNYWIHAKPTQQLKFLMLTTESGQQLHISRLHLIYETDCAGNARTTFAQNVQTGSCLLVKNGNDHALTESKVVTIEEVEKLGVYAPITENGNIVVNDVLASCFAEYENVEIQQLMFSFMAWAKNSLQFILPESVFTAIYSTPFASVVDIPEFLMSFMDLSKIFFR